MFLWRNKKKYQYFCLENMSYLELRCILYTVFSILREFDVTYGLFTEHIWALIFLSRQKFAICMSTANQLLAVESVVYCLNA